MLMRKRLGKYRYIQWNLGYWWPSWLGLQYTPTASLQWGKTPLMSVLNMTFCTIGPTYCAVKKEVCRKRNTLTRRLGKNIAVIFIRLWSLQLEKFLLLPSSRWWRGVCESWLFDTRLSQQTGRSRLGYDGLGPPEPLTHLFWQLPSTLPKSHHSCVKQPALTHTPSPPRGREKKELFELQWS